MEPFIGLANISALGLTSGAAILFSNRGQGLFKAVNEVAKEISNSLSLLHE